MTINNASEFKARVLVPMFEEREPDGTLYYGAGASYINRLTAAGLLPILVAPNMPPSALDELYKMCSGLLLMGGEDIDPALYGAAPHPQTTAPSRARDTLELELTKRALADKLPILGICRGCQMLAIASGGALHQHVPDIAPQEQHRVDDKACPREERLTKIFHDVHLEPDSKVAKLFQTTTVSLNSSHHQSVAAVGSALRIVGRTAAGVVEVIESVEPVHFVLGVQAHPEAMTSIAADVCFSSFGDALNQGGTCSTNT